VNVMAKNKIKFIYLTMIICFVMSTPLKAQADIAQQPLYLGGNVPGSLLLTPSVEWPTINSVANLGNYSPDIEFVGYFDSNKCYSYQHSATESERHFYPFSTTTNRQCPGSVWSGNFLNWAATQTIDPFRSALTGGNRVKDTSTDTWLEKARHDGQGGTSIYPDRRIPASGDNATMVNDATPFTSNWVRMRIEGLGNRMRFRLNNDGVNTTVTDYDPSSTVLTDRAYQLSVRVKVCDDSVGLESNCVEYQSGWKPEGTIQQYSRDIRYGVFGYLNDSDISRDGAVLRARSKFVGPKIPAPGVDIINASMEWDPDTGVLIRNPDQADATATSGTTINDSGVINYLNKFGQMTTQNHKSYDPVSELYYSAIRYYKNLGNVPQYSNMTSNHFNLADGFPVITTWDDPVKNWCQSNVILGIGDIYTHRDKNLPGNTTYRTDEPVMPPLVTADNTVNVRNVTNMVGQLEGIGDIANTNDFTGRRNSAYMAGLAYQANVTDIRPDLTGKVTVSTYWVDVLEALSMEGMARNQFALTAKYGGARVPDDYVYGDPLEEGWWHTNGQTLTPFGSRGSGQEAFKRPDNFFLAGQAKDMVESLKAAFASIVAEQESSAAAIATNSTRLVDGSLIYQARFDSRDWSGQIRAYKIAVDGSVSCDAVEWATSDIPAEGSCPAFDSQGGSFPPNLDDRKIVTWNGTGTTKGLPFTAAQWSNFNSEQQTALIAGDVDINGDPDETAGQNRINWIRGQDIAGMRTRPNTILGDIVNSDPLVVGVPNFRYELLPAGTPGKATYITYRQNVSTRPRMLFVGANDGMLHAFDAATGAEKFAYVPAGVFANLAELTKPGYIHKYYVDGSLAAGDAFVPYTDHNGASQSANWRTIVVGSLGAGGRSIYALDVTDPDNFSHHNVLWEFTHPDLGYTFGQPQIVRLQNGVWAAVFGNGYSKREVAADPDFTAQLFIVDLVTGNLIKKIDTGVGSSGTTLLNQYVGLSTPALLSDSQRTITAAYAGDLQGNLWKFDLSGNAPETDNHSGWTSAHVTGTTLEPLFTARNAAGQGQPITAPLEIGVPPTGQTGLMIYFGTGKYFEVGDNDVSNPSSSPGIQSFYGVWDNNVEEIEEANTYRSAADYPLVEQEIQAEITVGVENDGTLTVNTIGTGPLDANETNYRIISEEAVAYPGKRGWYLDLVSPVFGQQGERVVSSPLLRRGRIIFTTLIPLEDPCLSGGTSWLMELDATSGARLTASVFDVDKDGSIDGGDFVTVTIDGVEVTIPVSGRQSKVGIIKTPAVIEAGELEYKYFGGSDGDIEVVTEAGGDADDFGRRSWRQLQ